MHKVINPLVEAAKKDKDVIAVILFGSATHKKKYRDIDIALVLDPKMPRLSMSKKRLRYLANYPDMDIQIFNTLPIYVRKRVLEEGRVLVANNVESLYDIAHDTVRDFEDFRPFYNNYLEAVADA